VELPSEYDISATFNVFDLSLFDVDDDSRANPFERRNDVILNSTPRDPLDVSLGQVTRLRAKRFKEAINEYLQDT
jgi:hypothetical protein